MMWSIIVTEFSVTGFGMLKKEGELLDDGIRLGKLINNCKHWARKN